MTAIEFLRTGRSEADYQTLGGSFRHAKTRDRTNCADGFSVSIQAGEYLYSTPRADTGPWTAAELGFPSERPEPWADWEEYAQDPLNPTNTVYAYVPVELIEALIALHGGEA